MISGSAVGRFLIRSLRKLPGFRLSAVAVGGIGALLLVLWACTGLKPPPKAPEEFASWGLPPSLVGVLTRDQLDLLQLPGEVTEIAWLSNSSVRELVLRDSDIEVLPEEFPPHLTSLDLEGARRLENLPEAAAKLSKLNLRATAVAEFRPKGEALSTVLGVGSRVVETFKLPEVAPHLTSLLIDSSSIGNSRSFREVQRITISHQTLGEGTVPMGARELIVDQARHSSLDAIMKPYLVALEIRHPQTPLDDFDGLPPSLEYLTIESNLDSVTVSGEHDLLRGVRVPSGQILFERTPTRLEAVDLYPRGRIRILEGRPLSGLKDFRGSVDQARSLVSNVKGLSNVRLRLHVASLEELERVDGEVVALRFCDQGGGETRLDLGQLSLAPSLKILSLDCNPTLRDVVNIPQSVTTLSLAGTNISSLPDLPESLVTLDIRDTLIFDLAPLSRLAELSTLLLSARPEYDLTQLPRSLRELRLLAPDTGDEAVWNDFSKMTNSAPNRF